MTLVDIEIEPGIVTERTERGARNRWRSGNRVRFRQGLPEKLGGWQKTMLAGATIQGVPRGAIDWQAIDQTKITAIGTDRRLYLIQGGTVYNITPYRLFTDEYGGGDTELTNPFDTTNLSAVVNVSHTSHGLTAGTAVYFANATAVGGITIDGEYTVTSVVDGDNYTITHSSAATSTAGPGGGTVDYAYEINVGASAGGAGGTGYGAGTYGVGTWSTPRASSPALTYARTWSLDTWGEDLIANPRGGSIFWWDRSTGFAARAVLITNAPSEAAWVVVSPVDRHLIAGGCTPIGGSSADPLVIRWCDQNDFTDWTPARANTAGQRRLDSASKLIQGVRVREEILIFTDITLHAMTFVGPPATFNIRQIGSGCGLVGPLAVGELNGVAYWHSYEDLFVYDGLVRPLPCTIRNHVFEDINPIARSQFHVAINTLYQEVYFFYASESASEIDLYATYNALEGSWYYGALDRTAWLDQSAVRTAPAAFDASGNFYDHESGSSADGVAMGEHLESWDAEIPGPDDQPLGDHLMFVNKIVPDALRMDGRMSVTLKARKYPEGEQVVRGPFSIETTNPYIRPRIRGRQIAVRIESDQAFPATNWRLGTWRAEVRPHGRR